MYDFLKNDYKLPMFLLYVIYGFHTTSLVPSPSVISIASRVFFSLGALITPAGSAFMFQLSYPSAYAVPGPAR